MYNLVLLAHSWFRWLVLLAALVAVARAIGGVSTRRPWTPVDDRAGLWLTAALDLQMLLGLALFIFLSPVTKSAFVDVAAAMKVPDVRFFLADHPVGMIIAIALAHVGRVRIRKAADSESRHKRAAIFFGLALLMMLLSIPWPFLSAPRPLFRGL